MSLELSSPFIRASWRRRAIESHPCMDDDLGKEVMLVGVVEECLQYGANRWCRIRLPDGALVLINRKYIEIPSHNQALDQDDE